MTPDIEIYTPDRHDDALDAFMAECAELGLLNNANRKILKVDAAKFWLTVTDDKIVSMSGVQKIDLPDFAEVFRVQFRAATLPTFRGHAAKGLGRRFENCWEWTQILPYQVEYARNRGAKHLVVTTNTPDNDADRSGRMFAVDRVMARLEKLGDVRLLAPKVNLFNTIQNVWEITPAFEKELVSRLG